MLQQLNRQGRFSLARAMACALLLASCSSPPPDWSSTLDDLTTRFERSIGIPAAAGIEADADLQPPGRSLAEIETARLTRVQIWNRLQSIDPSVLSPEHSARYFALFDRLAPLIELDRYSMGGNEAPGPYLLTDRHGAYVTLITELTDRPIRNREDADKWLASLADAATAIDSETQRFQVEAASGVIPPAEILTRAIADLSAQLDPSREPAVLGHFRAQLAQLEDIPDFESTRLTDEARTIYAGELAPVLTTLRERFATLQTEAPAEPGLWAQPDGEERYRALFSFYVMQDVSPDEIATLAATAMEDARIEADAVLTAMSITDGEVGARLELLANAQVDDVSAIENVPGEITPPMTGDAMSARMTQRFDWARNNLAQLISAGEIRPLVMHAATLPAHEPRWPIQAEARPDPSSVDRLNYDVAEFSNWPDWSLPVLAYAEGLPGRHLVTSQRSFAHPVRHGAGAGLSDGWSLYATTLAFDLGGYDDRPEDRLGHLQYVILKAGLAETDVGIHQQRWSRSRAVEHLRSATGLAVDTLSSFVDEVIRRPGQSAAAFAGMEALRNFRNRADRRLGPKFDLRQFHNVLIAGGPRPLAAVERDVERWIAAQEAPLPTN